MKCSRPIIALGAIAILLIGVSGNACFAQTQQPPPPANRGPSMALCPVRCKCLELLELEKIKINPQTNGIISDGSELASNYLGVAGWLQGFFTAQNLNPRSDGNVTKEAKTYQIMGWIFSYCRAHPSDDLVRAAIEFIIAVQRDSTTKR